MQQNTQRPVSSIAYPILIALSISHCLNDLLQSVITATYPLFKEDLTLSFAQIGLITLVYQMSASVFQPVFGLFFDKRPFAWTLPMGMLFTMTGMLNLAFSTNLYWVLFSVFTIGIGSSLADVKEYIGDIKTGEYDIVPTYELRDISGICFELKDEDNCDEYKVPIDAISIYYP